MTKTKNKHSSLFFHIINDEGNFFTILTDSNALETFFLFVTDDAAE
jgi:hypothetical protein